MLSRLLLLLCAVSSAAALRVIHPAGIATVRPMRAAVSLRGAVVMAEEPLADGWNEAVDDQGQTYYWSTETRETTWTRPVAVQEAEAAAAPPPTAAEAAPPPSDGNFYDDETKAVETGYGQFITFLAQRARAPTPPFGYMRGRECARAPSLAT